MKIQCIESRSRITITVPQRSDRYIDELLHLTCAPDLLELKMFPNSKEVTESMAAYNAVRKYCDVPWGDPDVRLVDVACGHTPRTAALFAFRSRWQCIAIDPLLNKTQYNVKRLTCYKNKIEDVELPPHHGTTVITAVHAHVSLHTILNIVKSHKIFLIAMPCCVPLELEGGQPDIQYEDMGIWSDKRVVKIWQLIGNYI